MKITDNFSYEWKPSQVYHKITLFVVGKDEWNTKEGTGASINNAL